MATALAFRGRPDDRKAVLVGEAESLPLLLPVVGLKDLSLLRGESFVFLTFGEPAMLLLATRLLLFRV